MYACCLDNMVEIGQRAHFRTFIPFAAPIHAFLAHVLLVGLFALYLEIAEKKKG